MRRVTIRPFDRFGCSVVMADVAHELPREIAHGGEDAAGDHVSLDPSEPVLDLIEPGRIGRGEVQMDIRMVGEEFADALGLMGGKVVEDDVDLAAPRLDGNELAEKGDELLSRVPRRSLTEHRSGAGVESGVERESSVAVVLEAVSLGTP